MICPLIMTAPAGNAKGQFDCLEHYCAWWTGEQCAVTAIAAKKSELDRQYDFFLRMLKGK